MTLEQLRRRYEFDRMLTSAHAYWDADDPNAPANTCRYCGRHWLKWFGSKLDGHASCVVTDDFKQILHDRVWHAADITIVAAATALGVSESVMRSWITPIAYKPPSPRSRRKARAA
jgi:hypothetical protein